MNRNQKSINSQLELDQIDAPVGRICASTITNHSRVKRALKRALDVFAALLFFTFFGWLYVIVWFGVIATTGYPAIYRHQRVGQGGVPFDCLKFRSMVANSAEILHRHLADNPAARAEWEKDFKLRDDPRITKFGRILRKTSLDELPQFWNVLRGDMSLVGPRPVVHKELSKYYGVSDIYYMSVKPGITGPWQVGGRNDLDYGQRIHLDVQYAKTWSLKGDFMILVRTVVVVLMQRGSY